MTVRRVRRRASRMQATQCVPGSVVPVGDAPDDAAASCSDEVAGPDAPRSLASATSMKAERPVRNRTGAPRGGLPKSAVNHARALRQKLSTRWNVEAPFSWERWTLITAPPSLFSTTGVVPAEVLPGPSRSARFVLGRLA